ncbi:MAG: 4-hydroxybenzoate octaprenyltransferase [Candidatus Hinthialibacteria bacterium OLB16]|nr:MAG: 4-hydroxybenzoate octaprenyltransferase [Candidatus Hinthialibacteria bacterium OLB16]
MMRKYLELVKFSHTIFALPFAVISMLAAADGWPSGRILGWILVAMVCARTMAMTFNRIMDREIDALNPRTATRPLVTGDISMAQAWWLWGFTSLGFFLAAWSLNPLCLVLSPIVWLVLNGYSLSKRFTAWTHLLLGLSLGLAPLGAWVAVTGRMDWHPIPLSLAVILWVAGFDIIYSLQDEDIDKKLGLNSIVVRYGAAGGLILSRIFHFLAVILFLWFGLIQDFGTIYFLGIAVVAATLVAEHHLVSPEDRSKINAAFFTANGIVSLVLLAATCLDLALR